ncbi:AraC family transcriptional regulator [Sphaerisporangium siamense]|uniref:AraC-like DNA-binding protein n=1 Tax=Sphaerisporangium siamense TaxID=795645 RepID=A0A7W7DBD7_9ACTN|nr:helix-turn-helix domain-containing protein [Sphaerisporangium siamense]MBB4703712.1 AraC-like DNA-binding protein [Sphaerisporangium siamense]GII82184.1 AraC family transcriptional regulator [Sphaerisporangium siamense]
MGVLVRTADLPAGRRLDAWRAVVCDTLGPLDLRIHRDAPLRGEIEMGRLGPVGVGRVHTSTPHSVYRTAGLIQRDDREEYRVVLAVSGSPRVAQDGRATQLARGEFAVYDFTRPYELAYDRAVRLAVFSFPRHLLSLPPDAVASLAALPIGAESGAGALAVPLLRRVAADHTTYGPESAVRLSAVVTDLVGAAVAERLELTRSLPDDSRRRTLMLAVRAFIEGRLGDPGLDPAQVAAAHHVSVRYLHRLFEAESTTVAAWIRQRRLERCRAELARGGDEPVSAIAARWGLPDSAHFSRLFRRAYGMPPAEYRRAGAVR